MPQGLYRHTNNSDVINAYWLRAFDTTLIGAGTVEDGSVVEEKQLPIADESMTALVKARINIFFDESDALATKMYTGNVSLGQWQESMKQLIRECHTSTAAIGGGGWDEMTWAQWGRLGTPLREQYRWLQGFTEFIAENREDISLRAIQARARLYGEGAGGSTVLMQAGPALESLLPWVPKDGQSECLNRCHCTWLLDVTGKQPDGSQEVQAIWVLGAAEHCDTCVGRDGHVEMLIVPAGEVVPSRIGGI